MTRTTAAAVLLSAAALSAGAAWLRHGFIESETLAPLCLEAAAPWWCGGRALLETIGRSPWLAAAAVLASLLALRWRWLAGVGMAAGGVALAFSNLGLGAPAMVLGLLALVRQPAAAAPAAPE